jgi:peptidoglycan/xylan/chitin deacetylase (PgdA/CDA1 family)
LREFDIPFSVFVPTDFLNDNKKLFVDVIQQAINDFPGSEIAVKIDGQEYFYRLGTADERDDAAMRIILAVRNRSPEQRRSFVQSFLLAVGEPEFREKIYLSNSQLEVLSGFAEIGSHSVSHANLASLCGEELTRELRDSKNRLQSVIDDPVEGLAYPFGKDWSFSDAVKKQARECGYSYGLTTLWGRLDKACDLFAIPRIGVGNSTLRMKVNMMGINI